MSYAILVFSNYAHNSFRSGTKCWQALELVRRMHRHTYDEVVDALRALETAQGKVGKPQRWLSHFAGMESEASHKAMKPVIQLMMQDMTPGILDGFHIIRNKDDLKRCLQIVRGQ